MEKLPHPARIDHHDHQETLGKWWVRRTDSSFYAYTIWQRDGNRRDDLQSSDLYDEFREFSHETHAFSIRGGDVLAR